MSAFDPKQWDGPLLTLTASKCQTGRVTNQSIGGHSGHKQKGVNQRGSSSFRLKRNLDHRTLEHDSAPFAWRHTAVARRVHLRKRPRLERRHPQPEKVTMPLGLWPVLEIGARVQDLVVMQQLDVAWTEIHREMDRRV